MTAREVLERIHDAGGSVVAQGDKLKFRAPEPLPADVMALAKEHKPELLELLSGLPTSTPIDDWDSGPHLWARMPLSELEKLSVAIKIESDQYGTLWLVSTEAERKLADDDNATYTALEASQMLNLPRELVHQVHKFKRAFRGTLDHVEEDK